MSSSPAARLASFCQSKAPSGFTIINAKDAFKDAVTIKMVAEAGFSRKATSNDFYLPAVGNMDDRKIFVFETWKSGFDLNVHTVARPRRSLDTNHSGHVAGPCSSGLGSDVPV